MQYIYRATVKLTPCEIHIVSIKMESRLVEPQTPRLLLKLISAGFAFFVAGVNDGSLGSLIPYIREAYHIDTNMVAIAYGTAFCGWFFAALTNSHLGQYLDLGVFLVLGASLQVLAHALRTWLPPFPLFAVTFVFASLGQAYQDTYANTFVASVNAAHRWLGFIHAMYMAGCLVGPFLATAVASAGAKSRWELFYTAPLGLGVINFVLVVIAFRELLTWKRPTQGEAQSTRRERQKGAMKEVQNTLASPSVWILSLYFFFFLGAVITAGGWVVEYLVHVRNGDLRDMGYVPAGFYGGGFLGRLVLAEPTYRWGERRMIFIYILLCVGLELVFWLVPDIITEAVAISLLGFFSGPLFATGISVASKIFTVDMRSSALAFIFVLGQVGGAVFPAVTGIMATKVGVAVLQPMLVGLLGATGVSWLMLPKSRLHHD
ncbi:major facilitator superfamily domain-containing protein [Aspergillus coremiiformis]|uniref:Major facilitator superfamily domain-containing protein n=1 Tax=Aspergillus coremiiformis TaxID=138285 RepID=A0A5N6ZFA9_9EURO|nr:major facilitator superfamily domain-containing protein [Aspergillus coremiiformis]